MPQHERVIRQVQAVDEFNEHEKRVDGKQVVNSIQEGFDTLRNLLYERIHDDVEHSLGSDSIYIPVSEAKSEGMTKVEIDIYQVAESADEVGQRGYVSDPDPWYVQWLARWRLADAGQQDRVSQRLRKYLSTDADQRRLAFSDVLANVFPESRCAPLIVYRLFPLAVRISTDIAFGDRSGATEHRNQQLALLPAISECTGCHGRLLANEEVCPDCSSPLWIYRWLNAAD